MNMLKIFEIVPDYDQDMNVDNVVIDDNDNGGSGGGGGDGSGGSGGIEANDDND